MSKNQNTVSLGAIILTLAIIAICVFILFLLQPILNPTITKTPTIQISFTPTITKTAIIPTHTITITQKPTITKTVIPTTQLVTKTFTPIPITITPVPTRISITATAEQEQKCRRYKEVGRWYNTCKNRRYR